MATATASCVSEAGLLKDSRRTRLPSPPPRTASVTAPSRKVADRTAEQREDRRTFSVPSAKTRDFAVQTGSWHRRAADSEADWGPRGRPRAAERVNRTRDVLGRRFRPYPKYRDSGVPWMSGIPSHWESKVLKRQFRVVNGSTPKSTEPSYWDGDIPWVTPDDLGKMNGTVLSKTVRHITSQGYASCGTQMVPAGSLLLSTRAPIGHLAIAGSPVCTNQGCRSLVFRHSCSQTYYYFQVLAARRVLEAAGRGSTFTELASVDLESVPLAVPPLDEQRAVAAFLDRETAKIGALVAKKERLIELLQEKRTALISRAVTRGLDPSVPMKDSGVEWLGGIPSHWESRVLKRQFRVVNGSTPKSGEPAYWDGDIPWVTPDDLGKMNGAVLREPSRLITSKGYGSCGTRMVPAGSLLLSTRAPIGHLAIAGTAVCTNQGCRSLVFRYSGSETYFYFQVRAARRVLKAAGRGSTFTELANVDLESVPLAVPPLDEQRAVAAFLDRETAKLDALIAKVNEAIAHLHEYRAALVSAAVTGKIDIREEAA